MTTGKLANRLDVGRVVPIKRAVQIGTSSPGFLCRPVARNIEVTDAVEICPCVAREQLAIDAELLPFLHSAHCVTGGVCSGVRRTQVCDLPGLAVRQQPLVVFVALEAVLEEQFLSNLGGVFVPAKSESLFREFRCIGEDVTTALGIFYNALRRIWI